MWVHVCLRPKPAGGGRDGVLRRQGTRSGPFSPVGEGPGPDPQGPDGVGEGARSETVPPQDSGPTRAPAGRRRLYPVASSTRVLDSPKRPGPSPQPRLPRPVCRRESGPTPPPQYPPGEGVESLGLRVGSDSLSPSPPTASCPVWGGGAGANQPAGVGAPRGSQGLSGLGRDGGREGPAGKQAASPAPLPGGSDSSPDPAGVQRQDARTSGVGLDSPGLGP